FAAPWWVLLSDFGDLGDDPSRAAQTGAPDEPGAPDRRGFRLTGWEPAVDSTGWKFAAPQPVIVSCRWLKARALSAVEGERRSRESNDLNRRSHLLPPPPTPQLGI